MQAEVNKEQCDLEWPVDRETECHSATACHEVYDPNAVAVVVLGVVIIAAIIITIITITTIIVTNNEWYYPMPIQFSLSKQNGWKN